MKGYRTFIFFGVALALAIANLFGFADWKMDTTQAEIFSVVVPLVGLVLRYLTDTALFKKDSGE